MNNIQQVQELLKDPTLSPDVRLALQGIVASGDEFAASQFLSNPYIGRGVKTDPTQASSVYSMVKEGSLPAYTNMQDLARLDLENKTGRTLSGYDTDIQGLDAGFNREAMDIEQRLGKQGVLGGARQQILENFRKGWQSKFDSAYNTADYGVRDALAGYASQYGSDEATSPVNINAVRANQTNNRDPNQFVTQRQSSIGRNFLNRTGIERDKINYQTTNSLMKKLYPTTAQGSTLN
jgi:hypothetical protein